MTAGLSSFCTCNQLFCEWRGSGAEVNVIYKAPVSLVLWRLRVFHRWITFFPSLVKLILVETLLRKISEKSRSIWLCRELYFIWNRSICLKGISGGRKELGISHLPPQLPPPCPSPLWSINSHPLDTSICQEWSSNTENNCHTWHIIFTCPQDIKCTRTPSVSWLRGSNYLDPHSLSTSLKQKAKWITGKWISLPDTVPLKITAAKDKHLSWGGPGQMGSGGWHWPFLPGAGKEGQAGGNVAAPFSMPVALQNAWVPRGHHSCSSGWRSVRRSCQMNFFGWFWFIQSLRSSSGSHWLMFVCPTRSEICHF